MADTRFDLIVIGSGPGGYVAAIRAAQLGMKVAVVERESLGGICLNWGCIPTKALLRSADVATLLDHLDAYGFSAKDISFDLDKIVKRSRKVADQLSGGVKFLMKKNKITVIAGSARFLEGRRIEVETPSGEKATYGADHIIIATGARARNLPGLEADGKLVWTYREALVPDKMPKSLLVVGSGAIGIEFASFYAALGADVTVVEIVDRILPVEDEEISAFTQKALEKRGLKFRLSSKVNALKPGNDTVTATVEGPQGAETMTVDRVIMAVGIAANTENLGLEKTKVRLDRGHVVIDEWCRTGEPGVYAIGDVAGPPWLAHKASHEGVLCVEKIAGVEDVHPLDVTRIPGCTYCTPQVASIGLTERKARDSGLNIRVGRFPFMGNGKAIALGEPEGLVKTVFDADTGELLGAHMVGAEVTELIQGFGIAKTLESTEADLMHAIFPHPTLSEMMHESVLDAYDRVVHI